MKIMQNIQKMLNAKIHKQYTYNLQKMQNIQNTQNMKNMPNMQNV